MNIFISPGAFLMPYTSIIPAPMALKFDKCSIVADDGDGGATGNGHAGDGCDGYYQSVPLHLPVLPSLSTPPVFHFSPSPYTGRVVSPLIFASNNKVAPLSLELRVDYHLKRIMKDRRLTYFKDFIRSLPVEDRLNESIIEIIVSSRNLYNRRRSAINEAASLLKHLARVYACDRANGRQLLVDSFLYIRRAIDQIGQIVWALNSNKEHIKYVAKVYRLPDLYFRTKPDGGRPIEIKEEVIIMVRACQKIIERCDHLRFMYHSFLINMITTELLPAGGGDVVNSISFY